MTPVAAGLGCFFDERWLPSKSPLIGGHYHSGAVVFNRLWEDFDGTLFVTAYDVHDGGVTKTAVLVAVEPTIRWPYGLDLTPLPYPP